MLVVKSLCPVQSFGVDEGPADMLVTSGGAP